MRRGQHGVEREQREAGGRRFGGEHVQRRAGHLAGLNRFQQRRLVHQLAARAVDDAHARFHLAERLVREHALGFGRGGHVQRDVVAGGVQVRQAHQLDGQVLRQLGSHVGIVRHDAHLEGAAPA